VPLTDLWPRFDGDPLPAACTQWEEAHAPVETVDQTEAGGDRVRIYMPWKRSVSASFQCSSRWKARFEEYARRDRIDVSLPDAASGTYTVVPMRLRDLRCSLIQGSSRAPGTLGLYAVSFSLLDDSTGS